MYTHVYLADLAASAGVQDVCRVRVTGVEREREGDVGESEREN